MDYRFLKDKEQFTIDNAYNGYTKPATTLNIWIENKPNSVENRIVYKKESSKNHLARLFFGFDDVGNIYYCGQITSGYRLESASCL